MKEEIRTLINNLLDSALSRNTTQGIATYRKALSVLDAAESDQQVITLLSQVNNALAGIESHGFLTHEEFIWTKALRSLEPTDMR